MKEEIWKDIPDYQGYQASSLGRIRSLDMMVKNKKTYYFKKGRMLKQETKNHGYLWVSIKGKNLPVSVWVAKTFIDKANFKSMPEEDRTKINLEKLEVNHKDENKQNNCVDNLEWCTRQYNCCYSQNKPVKQFDKNYNFINKFKSIKEASEQTGVCNKHISSCCKGKYGFKTAGGYIWEYDTGVIEHLN